MKSAYIPSLWVWAARDVLRRPAEVILLGLALAALTAVMGTALLLTEALTNTAGALLAKSPALIIRKVNAGGWSPIPVAESLRIVRSVPGVLAARARIWGTVSSADGPLTIMGVDDAGQKDLLMKQDVPIPASRQAVVGPGVPVQGIGYPLTLNSREKLQFRVVGVFKPETAMATHDIVLLDAADARSLLGIPNGYASDLALDVFYDQEQEAILPDLTAAFPWPVRITTRAAALGSYTAGYARRGSLAALALIPAVLALAFIVVGTVRAHACRRRETGLLKALGWTTGDIVKLQMVRALLIAAPAVTLGLVAAYSLVFWPGTNWPGYVLFGWKARSPGLTLGTSGATLVMCEVGALAVLPFLLATLWTTVRGAIHDPQDLLEGNHS